MSTLQVFGVFFGLIVFIIPGVLLVLLGLKPRPPRPPDPLPKAQLKTWGGSPLRDPVSESTTVLGIVLAILLGLVLIVVGVLVIRYAYPRLE